MTSPFTWHKLGLIFRPDPAQAWMQSHAAVPTPAPLGGSLWRVYFSSRDASNRSHVGYFDVDLDRPGTPVSPASGPVLVPGPPGCYDGDGLYAECVTPDDEGLRIYFAGVTAGQPRPMFYAAIGMAHSTDGGRTFAKRGRVPIMTASEHDPCLVTAPFVLREGPRWRMWYVSGQEWTREPHGLQSHYFVKYAESNDGIEWRREGHVCLAPAPDETNVARLWVVPDGGRYRAWFSSSGRGGYRIGYAESPDGLTWSRADSIGGLPLSSSGWDSEAQAYPAVVRHAGRWFLFYNGNAYGRDGVGLAVAEA